MSETALITLRTGLSIGLTWLPEGVSMGVTSLKKGAEVDRGDEAPELRTAGTGGCL